MGRATAVYFIVTVKCQCGCECSLASVFQKLKVVDKAPVATPDLFLSSISLHDFRNYADARFEVTSAPVLVLGPNGIGKTNLLEALSLLAPGRGMRRARAEYLGRHGTSGAWGVAATMQSCDGLCQIGTGVPLDSDTGRRVMRLNGDTVSQAEIGTVLSASWLTPQMDGVFVDSPGNRRRFLDRLVIAFDPAHIARTNRYEKSLRERAVLLSEGRGDDAWLSALELNLAETAVAITAARLALIEDINIEAEQGWFGFPGARLNLDGDAECWLAEMPALAVEERLASTARQSRLQGEKTMPGPHTSELGATHLETGIPAVTASTGQQKALLIAVILAGSGYGLKILDRNATVGGWGLVAYTCLDRLELSAKPDLNRDDRSRDCAALSRQSHS